MEVFKLLAHKEPNENLTKEQSDIDSIKAAINQNREKNDERAADPKATMLQYVPVTPIHAKESKNIDSARKTTVGPCSKMLINPPQHYNRRSDAILNGGLMTQIAAEKENDK